MIKIGLIGAGFMGSMHAACYEILQREIEFRVTGVADLCKERANKLAKRFGVAAYSSGEELLQNADVNTVDICLPTYLHTSHANHAMNLGYNVFIEKPVCINETEAEELLKTQRLTGSNVMVGQCIRMWPEYIYLKKLVDSGYYGNLTRLQLKRISPKPTWSWDNWLHDAKRSGSAALDLHIHDVDYARYLLGEPERIKAMIENVDGRSEHIHALYYYPRAQVVLEGGWNYPQCFPFEMSYEANFERATIVFSSNAEQTLTVYPISGKSFAAVMDNGTEKNNVSRSGNITNMKGYYNELKYFVETLIKRQPIEIAPLIEGVRSVQLVFRELREAGQEAGKDLC